MDKQISVVIADDHPMFREGVVKTLSDIANCKVVAECGSADEALDAVCEHLPDIALLDVSMPGGGIEAARRIATACPVVRILMLTASENESVVMEALEVGARGYVLKGVGGEELAALVFILDLTFDDQTAVDSFGEQGIRIFRVVAKHPFQ